MDTLMVKRQDVTDTVSRNTSKSHPQDTHVQMFKPVGDAWNQAQAALANAGQATSNVTATAMPIGKYDQQATTRKEQTAGEILKEHQKKQTQPGDVTPQSSIATCAGTLVVVGAVAASLVAMGLQ